MTEKQQRNTTEQVRDCPLINSRAIIRKHHYDEISLVSNYPGKLNFKYVMKIASPVIHSNAHQLEAIL